MRDGEIISDEIVRKKKMIRTRAGLAIKDTLGKKPSAFGTAEFADYFHQAVSSIVSHKLRSMLSILGILIGVAAMISMVALGEGAKESITQSLSSLGSNLLTVRTGSHRPGGTAAQARLGSRPT